MLLQAYVVFAVQQQWTWCTELIIIHIDWWSIANVNNSKRLLKTEGHVGIRKEGLKQDVIYVLACKKEGSINTQYVLAGY